MKLQKISDHSKLNKFNREIKGGGIPQIPSILLWLDLDQREAAVNVNVALPKANICYVHAAQ